MARDCILYARYSSDKQNPKSCEDQLREARRYASNNGWRQLGEYSDHAISGRRGRDDRRGWDAMLAFCEAGHVGRDGVVLMWDLNRWSRDYPDGMIEALRLTKLGIHLADTRDGVFDQGTTIGRLLVALKLGGSDEYARDLSRGVRRGLAAKREAGYWTAPPPYGYRLERTEGGAVLQPDRREAPTARLIFGLVAGGATPAAAARELNGRGITTRRGAAWTPWAVRALCQSPVYLGQIPSYGGRHRPHPHRPTVIRIVAGRHEALIDQATWDAAARRLATVPRGPNGRQVRPLSGLVVCGECGRRAHLSGGDDHYRYYQCPGAKVGAGDCRSRALVRVGALEDAVRAWVRDQLARPEIVREAAARAVQVEFEEQRAAAATAAPIRAEIRDLEAKQARLLEALYAGDAPAVINRTLIEVEAALAAAGARLAAAGGETLPLDVDELAGDVLETLAAADCDLAALRTAIDRIVLPADRAAPPVLYSCGLEWSLGLNRQRKMRSDKGMRRRLVNIEEP